MEITNLSQVRNSYDKVGTATDERRARQNGWCGARDAAALDKVLPELDDDALIV